MGEKLARHLEISVPIRAPFITGNTGSLEMAFDAAMPRTSNNYYVFPESLIRGVLRDSLYSMGKRCGFRLLGRDGESVKDILNVLFGKSSADANRPLGKDHAADDPYHPRGRRHTQFSDLVSKEPAAEQPERKVRVTIDDFTGAAREAHLQTIEMAGRHGDLYNFSMTISPPEGADIELACELVKLAFKPLTAIAGSKTAGFGRIAGCVSVEMEEVPASETATAFWEGETDYDTAEQAELTLSFSGPFLVDAQRIADNAVEGATIVPGAAIKAAIFDALGDRLDEKDANVLSEAIFSHAFPGKGGTEQVLPFSLGYYSEIGQLEDLSLFKGIPLLRKSNTDYEAPVMAVDWKKKDRDTSYQKLGGFSSPPSLQYRDVTRTAIDQNTSAARYDEETGGQLFSARAVVPRDTKDKMVSWLFRVRSEQLKHLLELMKQANARGLLVGKLKTRASLTCNKQSQKATTPLKLDDIENGRQVARIMLRTPALMFDYGEAGTACNLGQIYSAYFQAVFPDIKSLKLDRFFAEQEVRGGYQALRFRIDEDYKPWILTKPGSVFVLSVTESEADEFKAMLEGFVKSGIPPRAGEVELHWENCPFICESGYGEIAVNPVPRPKPKKVSKKASKNTVEYLEISYGGNDAC